MSYAVSNPIGGTPIYPVRYEWHDAGGGISVMHGSLTKEQRESAVSLMETYEEAVRKAEEKDAKSAPIPEYAIAHFDFGVNAPTDIRATGDSKFDKKVREAIAYYNSCFDFTNSADFLPLMYAEDLTGLTNAEKYAAIYQRYQHCYGENFLEGNAADTWYIPPEYNVYKPVIDRFKKAVESVCGKNGVEKARKEALYGDCENDTEVREAIIKKYMQDSPDGRITHRNYFKMTYEMDLCGVGGGISKSLRSEAYMPQNIFEFFKHNPRGDNSSEEYLNSYVTRTDVQDFYNSYSYVDKCYSFDTSSYLPALNQITAAITADKNSDLRNTIDSLLFNN